APKAIQIQPRNDGAAPETIHVLTGVNDARNKLGLTGKGVKVAILDTGVYYKHPALGGCFGPGCKVAFGLDLVGDALSAGNPTVAMDDDPIDDCSDGAHGTHVAGILAGNALNITDPAFLPEMPWSGVAPDITIGAYRIFGCAADGTFDDIIASAIYQAAADGADIINLSIGNGPSLPDQAEAAAVDRVSAAGVIVVASNGNEGAQGYMSSGNPGGSLTGYDGLSNLQTTITVDDVPFSWIAAATNSDFGVPSESLDIFVNNPDAIKNDIVDDGCTTIGAGAKGKTVLLRFGSGCGSVVRCTNAQRAGAKNCLVYMNTEGNIILTGGPIPTASIPSNAGAAIVASSTRKVVISKQTLSQFSDPSGATASTFTSTGLDAELHIKPDIGAIGSNVYSCISPYAAKKQNLAVPYSLQTGTSMSSPYFAGAVALYLQSRQSGVKPTFETVRTAFQNNAIPTKMYKSDMMDSVALQGAGLVNVYSTITSKSVITPSFLALNDSQFTSKTHYTLTLTSYYSSAVAFTFTNVGAATVYMFDGVEDFIQPASSTKYTTDYAVLGFGNKQEAVYSTVVQANASVKVNIDVTQPPNADPRRFPIFSGFVRVTNNFDDDTVTVPYAGMVGNWTDAGIFSRN
ncbi:peptidase S8/S53 domain-containing protein, partial [Zopfochytrium polystomum]